MAAAAAAAAGKGLGEFAGPMAISWAASHVTHAAVWGYVGKQVLDKGKSMDSGMPQSAKVQNVAQRTLSLPALSIKNWRHV